MMGVFVQTNQHSRWANRDPVGYVIQEDGCWEWIGSKTQDGYGNVWIGKHRRRAHRVLYEARVGPIPTGLQLDHRCRNRACVNPDHLEPVTTYENVVVRGGPGSAGARSRQTHCLRGHAFTPDNTRWQVKSHEKAVSRSCITCCREHARKRRAKREAA